MQDGYLFPLLGNSFSNTLECFHNLTKIMQIITFSCLGFFL